MTNRFSDGVAVVAGVVVDLRLRLRGHDGTDKVKVMLLPAQDLIGGAATSVPSFTRCAGASPAPALPLPPMVRFGGIHIHSRVQTLVTTMDRGCGRLLWLAARARH